MPEERNYYVLCDDNCRFEGMTEEQILSAIQEAVEGITHGVEVSATNDVVDLNLKKSVKLWIGTKTEYDAISQTQDDVLYVIAEHNEAKEVLIAQIENVAENIDGYVTENLNTLVTGAAELVVAFNPAQAERMALKDNLSRVTNIKSGISESFQNYSERQEVIDVKATTAQSKATTMLTNAETYLENRESIEELWSGEQGIGFTETELTLSDDWKNYSELAFVVGYSSVGLLQKNVFYKKISGEPKSFVRLYRYLYHSADAFQIFQTSLLDDSKVKMTATYPAVGYSIKLYKIYGIGVVE